MILYFHSAHSLRSYRKMRYRAFSHAPQCVIQFPIKVPLRRTLIPLPAPRRRGLVRRADERGLSEKVSLELFRYLRGTESPLEQGLSAAEVRQSAEDRAHRMPLQIYMKTALRKQYKRQSRTIKAAALYGNFAS